MKAIFMMLLICFKSFALAQGSADPTPIEPVDDEPYDAAPHPPSPVGPQDPFEPDGEPGPEPDESE